MEFKDRLRELRGSISQADFAKRLKINVNTLRNYERGASLPNLNVGADICQEFNVSPSWLLFGEESARPDADATLPPKDTICPISVGADPACELVMVPKVRARLSAGTGSLETESEVVGRYAFRSEWIRSKGQVSKMVLMGIIGESMQPALLHGDTALIDESQRDILAGAIYAVGLDDEVVVKYVDKVPGKFILRSANKDYPPIEVNLDNESLNVRIIGRVLWWCREAWQAKWGG